jgi:hypothetical protein
MWCGRRMRQQRVASGEKEQDDKEKGHELSCAVLQVPLTIRLWNAISRKKRMQTKRRAADRSSEREQGMSSGNGSQFDAALLIGARDGIRLIGGAATIWNRCLAAGWIRPARRVGLVVYYRYRDISALAERLCRERPPGLTTVGRIGADQR